MAVTTDIVRTWRGPRAVVRDLLSQGKREDRAIAYVMVGCLIVFISYLPAIQFNAVRFDGDFQRDASYAFLMWVMVMPLLLYGVAAVLHLIARILGGQGTFYTARLAFFWSFLASTPALLLYGLVRGFIGPGLQADIIGTIWFVAFAFFTVQSLREAERGDAG